MLAVAVRRSGYWRTKKTVAKVEEAEVAKAEAMVEASAEVAELEGIISDMFGKT